MALHRPTDFRRIGKEAAQAASEKKAEHIQLLDIRKDSDVADYMLIASAGSTPHLRAIYEGVVARLTDIGIHVIRQDGHAQDRWVALDYGGLLVHILTQDARSFYRLEYMWENPHMITWDEAKGSRSSRRHPRRS